MGLLMATSESMPTEMAIEAPLLTLVLPTGKGMLICGIRSVWMSNVYCEFKGEPHGMAPVVCHLAAHEPGNLLFAYLLQNGIFHRLCKQYAHDRNTLKSTLILVFANLFTSRRLPLGWDPNDKQSYPSDGESKVRFDDSSVRFIIYWCASSKK